MLLGIVRGICFEPVEDEGEPENFLLALLEVEARGTASRWACMRE